MPGMLIADDMAPCRDAIVAIVGRARPHWGPVVEAGSGEEAVVLARLTRPDLVLMEIQMPGLNGLEAGAQIRAEQPQTRLVMLSAHQEFAYAQQALRIGASDYLLKPVDVAHLLATLDQLQAQLQAGHTAPTKAIPSPLPERMPLAADGLPNLQTPLARALAYMQRNFQRPDLRLSDVACVANLSPSHLAALLRRHLGRNYSEHLGELRIDHAKQLLRSTNLTIAAIAQAVGYTTPAPFYQRFKQSVGMTPLEFRTRASLLAVGG